MKRQAIVWEVKTGKEVFSSKKIEGHNFAISNSAKQLFYCKEDENTNLFFYFYDIKAGKVIKQFKCPLLGFAPICQIFSSDGKTVYLGGNQKGTGQKTIFSLNVNTGKIIKLYKTDKNDIFVATSLSLSKDGRRLYSGTNGTMVEIWDTKKGEKIGEMEAEVDAWQVQLAANGQELFVGDKNQLYLYDLSTREFVAEYTYLKGKKVAVFALAPNGKLFSCMEENGKIFLFNLPK